MNKRLLALFLTALVVLPLIFIGCKGKVERSAEEMGETEGAIAPTEEAAIIQEPAQNIGIETIPPTATPPSAARTVPVQQMKQDRNKEIQKALKAAGYYASAIDGRIGPKTLSAIEAFQKAKGLKADGKVGPKTWAELEKYLIPPQPQE